MLCTSKARSDPFILFIRPKMSIYGLNLLLLINHGLWGTFKILKIVRSIFLIFVGLSFSIWSMILFRRPKMASWSNHITWLIMDFQEFVRKQRKTKNCWINWDSHAKKSKNNKQRNVVHMWLICKRKWFIYECHLQMQTIFLSYGNLMPWRMRSHTWIFKSTVDSLKTYHVFFSRFLTIWIYWSLVFRYEPNM